MLLLAGSQIVAAINCTTLFTQYAGFKSDFNPRKAVALLP